MALGIGGQLEAGLADGNLEPDGGQHVLQRAPVRHVIEDVVDRHQRQADGGGQAAACSSRNRSLPA